MATGTALAQPEPVNSGDNVTTGDFDSSAGTKAYASGSLQVRRDDDNSAVVVYKGGTLDSNKSAEIKANGEPGFQMYLQENIQG